jgi:dipeptidyl aminopeptidase/acylaminoacyl peptidase
MSQHASPSSLPPAPPFGLWPSPIGAALVAAGATPLSQLRAEGGDVYWVEGRATEKGRGTLMRRRSGRTEELTPAPFNVRTRVHEYGGMAWCVADGLIWFSNQPDHCLYELREGQAPRLLTPPSTRRYADMVFDRRRQRLIAVCEQHGEAPEAQGDAPVDAHLPPQNMLCAVGMDGQVTVIAQGHDFYAAPRLSPDGSQLAWLTWDQPRMPWESSTLWLADVQADGSLGTPRALAGGPAESICQPEWSPQGVLHCVSDRGGWWNLYRVAPDGLQALYPCEAEFGVPHWSLGVSLYDFMPDGRIAAAYIEQGIGKVGLVADGSLRTLETPYQEVRELRVAGTGADARIVLLAGAPTRALEIAQVEGSAEPLVLAASLAVAPDPAWVSVPQPVSFPSLRSHTVHAFFYPPRNPDVGPPSGLAPPLIVIGHGGPTGMASNTLKLATQFWTSRGFAVLDVNYGGSTGFGRAYRDLLRGEWGVLDVEDCVAGARYLAEHGVVDGQRLIIRGSSAGGLTVLNALIHHAVFKAGACYYGVSDLQGLDDDSHKFESHYNAWLIAPQPQAAAIYRQRSPIHHVERLSTPMVFFQGLDDKVVPPRQSEAMVEALRAKGVPVAYLPLEGEGHGFRQAATIVATLEAELYFYQRVLGLAGPAQPAPIRIDNLPGEA